MIRENKNLVNYVADLCRSSVNNLVIEESVNSGQVVIEQKKRIFSVYIIRTGIAKCYMTQDTGTDFIQEFFGEGEIFGEIEMFNNDLSFCSIEAITPLTIFKIQKDDFHMLIDQDKTFSQLILKSLTAKIKYTAIRHSYNQSHTIEANLMRLKRSFPNLNETIPKRDLANYLGITERSLNRVLKAATVN